MRVNTVRSATNNLNYAYRASGLAPGYMARETHSPVEWRVEVKPGQFKTPTSHVWEDVFLVDCADVDASAGVCDELVDEDITFQVKSTEIDNAEQVKAPVQLSTQK